MICRLRRRIVRAYLWRLAEQFADRTLYAAIVTLVVGGLFLILILPRTPNR